MADYLADPCATPSLRSSDIQRMLLHRPAHVRALHPRLTDPHLRDYAIRKASRRMDIGSVIHALVLGEGSKFTVLDPTSFKTKQGVPSKTKTSSEYKQAAADARSLGLIVLDPSESETAQRAADRLIPKLVAHFGRWPLGVVEKTIVWTEQTEHGPVMCRTRPDFFDVSAAIEGDVKSSAAGLSDDELQRTLSGDSGRTFVQAAWQRRGLLAHHPELAGRIEHMHVYIETEPPYEPRIVNASVTAMEMADRRCMRAVAMFAQCMASGEWPGWDRTTITPASWLDSRWVVEEEESFA